MSNGSITPERLIEALAGPSGQRCQLPETIMCVYHIGVFRALMAHGDWACIDRWYFHDRPARQVYVLPGQEQRVGMMYLEIGAPMLAYMIEILRVCGVRRIVLLTTAGAVTRSLGVGDYFIIQDAYSDNGVTSYYYSDERIFRSTPALDSLIVSAFAKTNHAPAVVRSFSSDRFFRPDLRDFESFQPTPEIVEMEAATAFALARRHRLEASVFGYIGDVLPGGWRWETPKATEQNTRTLVSAVQHLVAALAATRSDREGVA